MPYEISAFIDFDQDGFGAGDDVSAWLMELDTNLGITEPMERIAQVGTCAMVLSNLDKRFSPDYAAGPYFGKWKPGLPVRIEIVDGMTLYPIFYGVTAAIRPTTGEYGERTATIDCVDAIARLQDHTLNLPLLEDRRADELAQIILAETWRSGRATGQVTFSGLPAVDNTITVDGITYTFKASVSTTPNQVKIGASIEECADNLLAALNGADGDGSLYGEGTERPERSTAEPNRTYNRAVLADRPVRYYRMGEPSGTTMVDAGSNGRDGTYHGVAIAQPGALAGDPNTAALFDGVNDYCSMPVLDLAGRSFTLEGWIKPVDHSGPTNYMIFGMWKSWATGEWGDLLLASNGQMIFRFGGGASYLADVGTFTFGTWQHVAVVYDHAASTLTMYRNGAPVSGALVSGPPTGFTARDIPITLGWAVHSSNFYGGNLDEMALYYAPLPASRIKAHYDARAVAPGALISARTHGAYGNAITLAKTGANIAVSGSTLTGGANRDPSLTMAETGRQTFALAGDRWNADVNALTAMQDVVESEFGLFWCRPNGVMEVRNRDYEFRQSIVSGVLTLNSEQNELEIVDHTEVLYNRITTRYTPRRTLLEGVIARANNTVTIPARSGNERWTSRDLDPAQYEKPEDGLVMVRLPYVEAGSGRLIGARSLRLPLERGVDIRVGDRSDGSNSSEYDYTYDPSWKASVVATGSGVEVSFSNSAIGNLYATGLQVRGEGIVAQDEQEIVADDAASIEVHGRRELSLSLPLVNEMAFAQVLARLLLRRHKDARTQVRLIGFNGALEIGSFKLFSLTMGHVITLSDAQTGMTAKRYLVTGVKHHIRSRYHVEAELGYYVRELEQTSPLILDYNPQGLLNGTRTLVL